MIRPIPALALTLALAFPATASAKTCPSDSVYELTKVTNVGCGKAKRVLRDYWRDGNPALGFDCKQKQYPGGSTTTCRKGDKRIKHFSAD